MNNLLNRKLVLIVALIIADIALLATPILLVAVSTWFALLIFPTTVVGAKLAEKIINKTTQNGG